MADFRTRFNQALAAKAISRRELARLSGVHVNTLNNWAGGDVPQPHPTHLRKVAPLLGVSYEWLRTGEEAAAVAETPVVYGAPGESPFDSALMEQVVRLVEDYAKLYRLRLEGPGRVDLMERAYQRCRAAGLSGAQRISMSRFQELVKPLAEGEHGDQAVRTGGARG